MKDGQFINSYNKGVNIVTQKWYLHSYSNTERRLYYYYDCKKIGKSSYAYYGKYKKLDGSWKNYYKSGFSTIKAAKLAEESFILGITNNTDQDITFDELVKMFGERSVSMNIKESTLIGHESYYNNHIRGFFGDKNISSITPGMIEVWKMEMIRKKTPDGKRYSARTINHAKSTLSRYLSYAEQLDLIKYNPCRKVPDYINQSEIIKRNEDEKISGNMKNSKNLLAVWMIRTGPCFHIHVWNRCTWKRNVCAHVERYWFQKWNNKNK